MVYETNYYSTHRPYTSSYSSRPTISSYSVTPSYIYDDDYYTPSYSYQTPIRVPISYSRVGSYISRPSVRYDYDTDYDDEPYYSSLSRVLPSPITRISTLPSRVYRERISPVRFITPPTRIYQRDAYSPVRIVSTPTTIFSTRVRPSVLSREFDRIERKYRSSPVGPSDTDEYLNYWKTNNFNDETREIRTSTRKLMREVNEPVYRNQTYSRYARASSSEPAYSRFDPDLIDKYGNQQIDNEYYVNRNILRPTRNTRDQIEILSNLKYREPGRRYIVKKEKTTVENKPLVVVKPSVVSEGVIETAVDVSSSEIEEKSD